MITEITDARNAEQEPLQQKKGCGLKLTVLGRAGFVSRTLAHAFQNVTRQVARLVQGIARKGLRIRCSRRKKVRQACRKTRVFFEMP